LISASIMIVIVGAGLAGLSAAYKLIKLGHENIQILEAKSRPGGRIESKLCDDGSRIDFGAQWLHGREQNPIYSWLSSLELIDGIEEEEVELEGLFRTQSGAEPDRRVVSRTLELLMDAKHTLYKSSDSIGQGILPVEFYRTYIKTESKICPVLKSADCGLVESVLRWFELYETIDNSCENLSLLSMKAYSEWTDFDEGQMVRLKGGWQGVIDFLVKYVGTNRIQLNCPVRKIRYSADGVTVFHLRGSTQCNLVILTQSIGVLRDNCEQFFEPSIPTTRIQSLNKLGFGTINKIFLEFERPFLHDEKGLKMLWLRETRGAETENKFPDWTKFITGFDLVSSAPNFLMAWLGGDGAKMMEHLSDEEVGATCLSIFHAFAPDKTPPKLVSVTKSNWASDPFIKGAYSYQGVLSADLNLASVWQSIEFRDTSTGKMIPRIMFAGEATEPTMESTAHGAIMSGWRQADNYHQTLGCHRPMVISDG